MNFGLLGQAAVVLIVGTWLLTRFSRWGTPQKSVEVEQDETREVVAHAAWWNGVCVESDLDAECPFSLDSVEDKDDWLRRHLHRDDRPAA